jgi:hypothetical protein
MAEPVGELQSRGEADVRLGVGRRERDGAARVFNSALVVLHVRLRCRPVGVVYVRASAASHGDGVGARRSVDSHVCPGFKLHSPQRTHLLAGAFSIASE